MAKPPTDLPVARSTGVWRPLRMAVLGIVQAVTLLGLHVWWGSFELRGIVAALSMVVVLALLNAVLWPLVIRLALPAVLLTAGLFTLVLNALFVWSAAGLVDGVRVDSFWIALGVAFVLSLVNLVVGGLLSIADDNVERRRMIRRMVRRTEQIQRTDDPGYLFIQIDGLGHDVLAEAMEAGRTPFLAALVEGGTHRMVGWECDLSSQTGAMQAGILLGDNANMPAFRWYEKDSGRILVSNRPADAADIEARQSSGNGLLVDGGASRGNVFSGDAPDAMFTFSTVTQAKITGRRRFAYVVSTPYSLFRIVALMVVEVARERREARRAKSRGTEPRMHRGGIYPILRAGTTVALAEVTTSLLIADIIRGVPSAYVDYVGYDEVAHHSGIRSDDALDTLTRLDGRLARLLSALDDAPRPYHAVILSDHGQTQGATFQQRYGESLGDVVRRLALRSVTAPVLAEEGWNNVNGLLTDAASDDSTIGRVVARSTRSRTRDGEVVLGPDTGRRISDDVDDIVVLASGNLGLLSFPRLDGRASRQDIDSAHPGLLDGLRGHPGIGFALVRDDECGAVVLGPHGERRLELDGDAAVDGEDPLGPFGARAADHLRRTSSFLNCPDVVLNSFYDPDADEGAAFEELIGFHGGLGGAQGHPFVLAPTGLDDAPGPIVGAEAVHRWFKGWVAGAPDMAVPHGR